MRAPTKRQTRKRTFRINICLLQGSTYEQEKNIVNERAPKTCFIWEVGFFLEFYLSERLTSSQHSFWTHLDHEKFITCFKRYHSSGDCLPTKFPISPSRPLKLPVPTAMGQKRSKIKC
ncbi:hypothetical protein LXL04_011200 [Taraxacum kok-saghyz]